MDRKELEQALNNLSDEEFISFVKKFGGTHPNRESVIRSYVDHPKHERRLCQLLDLPTEYEKQTQASVDAAKTAKWSAVAAAISAVIALIALIITLF